MFEVVLRPTRKKRLVLRNLGPGAKMFENDRTVYLQRHSTFTVTQHISSETRQSCVWIAATSLLHIPGDSWFSRKFPPRTRRKKVFRRKTSRTCRHPTTTSRIPSHSGLYRPPSLAGFPVKCSRVFRRQRSIVPVAIATASWKQHQ